MRNGVFGIASTGLSGLSNLVVQLFVASLLPASEFGRFSLFSATVLFLLGLGRAVIGQTDILRGRTGHDDEVAASAYSAAAVLAGLGVVLLPGAALLPGTNAVYLAVAVGASAAFVLQDAARFRAFRMHRAGVAFSSDALLLTVAIVGLFISRHAADPAPWAATTWVVATTVAFIPAAVALRFRPGRFDVRWLKRHSDLIGPSMGEYLLQATLPYLVNWAIVGAGGLEALAGYRLIQLLFAAVANIALGLNSSTVPRVADRGSAAFARRIFRLETVVVAAVSALVLLACAVLPPGLGTTIFGESWEQVGPFLFAAGLHGTLNALAIPAFSLLRLLGDARYSLLVRAWSGALSLVLVAAALACGAGAPGAAWGLAGAAGVAYAARLTRAAARLTSAIRNGDHLTPPEGRRT